MQGDSPQNLALKGETWVGYNIGGGAYNIGTTRGVYIGIIMRISLKHQQEKAYELDSKVIPAFLLQIPSAEAWRRNLEQMSATRH